MLEATEYRNELQDILMKVREYSDSAEIRGSDTASFIFAKKGNRAIEIYQSETSVIVEFWENEEQKSETEVDTYQEAAVLIIDYIKIK